MIVLLIDESTFSFCYFAFLMHFSSEMELSIIFLVQWSGIVDASDVRSSAILWKLIQRISWEYRFENSKIEFEFNDGFTGFFVVLAFDSLLVNLFSVDLDKSLKTLISEWHETAWMR